MFAALNAVERQDDFQPVGATEMIASFVCHAKVDAVNRNRAARALVDTLAVTVAGSAEPGVGKLETLFGDERVSSGAVCPWNGRIYGRRDAALLIGTASHVLDYDDVSMLTVCHPSAPVLSAILAAAPDTTSGVAVLEALAIGTEVLIRLGQAMGFRHYAIGFHATATLGAVGAAAACSRLLGLDQRTTQHAIAIAASHAGGLRKNFGTMVKSLHVGIAASNGLQSVRMAQAGLDGATEILEGEGYLNAFSGAETDRWPQKLRLGQPFVLAEPGFEQKRYPCCYQLHKLIEATLSLRREHAITLADIAAARVDMMTGATKPLIHPYPKTGLNALFSGPYAVLASLEDGAISLRSFTDEAVLRPHIQSRLSEVGMVESDAQGAGAKTIGDAPVTVTLTLRDGRVISRTVVLLPGSVDDPLTDADLEAKWTDCLQRARRDIRPEAALPLLAEGLAIGSAPSIAPWLARVADAVKGA